MGLALLALKRKSARLVSHILLMPAYWLLISFATYRAVWQVVTRQFAWEKTEHGVSKFVRAQTRQRTWPRHCAGATPLHPYRRAGQP